jgi:hypothetical protein
MGGKKGWFERGHHNPTKLNKLAVALHSSAKLAYKVSLKVLKTAIFIPEIFSFSSASRWIQTSCRA